MAKILLVDDDPDMVETNRIVLTSKGHDVQAAGSAEEARQMFAEDSFDAMILDVMMETHSAGFDLARELHEKAPALPIIMLTGVLNEAGVPFKLEPDQTWLPVAKFLEKPVAPDVLASTVQEALAGA